MSRGLCNCAVISEYAMTSSKSEDLYFAFLCIGFLGAKKIIVGYLLNQHHFNASMKKILMDPIVAVISRKFQSIQRSKRQPRPPTGVKPKADERRALGKRITIKNQHA